MRQLGLFLGGVVLVTPLLSAAEVRADVTTGDEMATALADFDLAAKDLSLTAPCDTMCRALQSMVRAANRICELARDSSPSDQKKCSDAKAKVADATAKVRAACPNCYPAPPYAPSTTPAPPPVVVHKGASGKAATSDDAGDTVAKPAPAPDSPREYAAVAGVSRSRHTTVSLDVLPLFAPPFVIQPRIERAVTPWFSITITGGFGSLPKNGPDGKGRTSVMAIGGELRGYVFGGFDRFGVFVAADVMHRSASLELGGSVSTRTYPLGLSVGGVVGTKLVTYAGLTLEARIGASYLASDRRNEGGARVFPHGGVSLGWTF